MGEPMSVGKRASRMIVHLVGALVILPPIAMTYTGEVWQSEQSKAGTGGQSSQADVRKLEVGEPIERELAGGESHSYEIELQSGRYVKAVVEQRGIDVAVTAIGPDGKEMFGINDEPRPQGLEEIAIVAESSGVYRLRVASTQKAARAARYEIRVAEARPVTETDRVLHEARTLSAASGRLRDAGKYDEALLLAERALTVREKALGPKHPDVAHSLNLLAALYHYKGDYAKAEPLYQRSLTVFEKGLGPEHPHVARSVNNLASLYHDKGDNTKAEPLYERALAIREKALGPEHPDVAWSLNSLAAFCRNQGDNARAESLYQRALAIWEKVLGPEHPNVAGLLNNLAILYYVKGDYAKAEPLHQRALVIWEKALGPEHPYVAQSLNELAGLYTDKGDYAKAEPLYQRALAIFEKTLGGEHPNVAASLNSLAILYRNKGDNAKAELLYQRALAVWEKALGPDHPDVAYPLNNLANLYTDKGDYAKAEPLHQRALAIREKALGPEHPDVAVSLHNLAELYRDKGDYAKAISHQSRAVLVSELNVERNIATGSERQKLAYLATLSKESDATLALQARYMPHDPAALRLAVTTILQRKGRALDATADSVAALRRRLDPQDQAILDQLTAVRSSLAKLVLDGPGRKTPAEHQAEIKQLEEKVERLENDLSRRSAEFRAQSRPVTLEAVQAAIPPGTALVEFAAYNWSDPKQPKTEKQVAEIRYVAYVLCNQGDLQWVELGQAKEIDNSIDTLRKALRDPNTNDTGRGPRVSSSGRADVKRLARTVDETVMLPVRRLLRNNRKVLISPDGALNLLPFAALVDEQNRYLVDRYTFIYLTTGRDLLRPQEKIASKQGPMLIGNPAYDDEDNRAVSQQADNSESDESRRSGDYRAGAYLPLAGAEQEVDELSKMLSGAKVLKKTDATESALKQVRSPSILHIATHGFFLADQKQNVGEDQRGAVIENPMLRSGLALAGANKQRSGSEDGVLTALEAAGLDLWGTKLVVLSACDTGVGDVLNGNGVFGLRRALVLAGSETQVMSLWAVSDEATRELMVEYYRGLQRGDGRAEALRQVQLRMLRAKERKHPYYWASFIQSGEWANLEGKR